jgi:hypothetical protein
MMAKTAFLLPVALLALLFGACTTTNPTPAAPPVAIAPAPAAMETPVPERKPAPVVELAPASITGSEETSTLLDNFTVFVTAIDGVPVTAGRAGWSTAVPLKAGQRHLTLAFNRGVFAAQTEISFSAVSETAYQVKFATDAQLFDKNSYCEFWIVNAATGEPVTPRLRAPLTRIEAGK